MSESEPIYIDETDSLVKRASESVLNTAIEAVGDYVCLRVGTQSHLLRDTMSAMEARLDHRFLRIHRSVIVNTERIKEFHPGFNGEYTVVLQNGTELKSSRGYRDRLRGYFGDSL